MAITLHAKHQRAKRKLIIRKYPPITHPPRTLFNSWPIDQFETKGFSLGEVLTITTGRLLTGNGIVGLYDILNWMTGDNLFTHQLPRAGRICKPYLIEQYPQLDPEQNPKLQTMTEKLLAMLKTESGQGSPDYLIKGWLSSVGAQFWGLQSYDKLDVIPLSASQYQERDPMEELAEMVGKDKIITIQAPASEDSFPVTIKEKQ